jgi:hypothetical protein
LLPKGNLPVELKQVTAKTRIGSWLEYSVRNKEKKQKFRWKIALVGKKDDLHYWWEHTLRWGRLRSIVIKLLVQGKKHDPQKVVRMIWQPAGHQAVEIPVKKGKKMMQLYTPVPRGKAKRMGVGPLHVVAGKFFTNKYVYTHRDGKKTRFWTSGSVPLLGLVKLLSPGLRMELIAYGQNAKSQITGKPGKLPIPVK